MTDEKQKTGLSDLERERLYRLARHGDASVLEGIEILVESLIGIGQAQELRDVDPRAADILGKCQGCDRPVIWVGITKKDGKPGRLPLDARAPVYQVEPLDPIIDRRMQTATRLEGAYVSHFATCKKPDHFSQVSRRRTDA